MPNNEYPVLDGIAPSWADVTVQAITSGNILVPMKGIKAINTGTSVEIGTQIQGGRVIKRTAGQGSQEASLTMYYDNYVQFLRAIKSEAPQRGNVRLLSLVVFGVQMQYTPYGSEELFETRIKGCRFVGRNLNGTEGTDATEVEVQLNVIEVVDVVDGEEVAAI